VACDYLYVSYYFDGLRIYNISDPANPVLSSFYNTSNSTHAYGKYEGAWGVYPFLPSGNVLVSDMQKGLFIVPGPEDNCSERQTTNCNSLVSSNENPTPQQPALRFFPQPAQDELNVIIQLDAPTQETMIVEILDLSGRVVSSRREQSGTNFSLSLNELPNGIYLLRAAGSHFQTTKKLVVQR
ncbi:MAG: T9SS type A sorting domain-containing protein, partial [Bacteroidota bacterium]